MSKSTRVEVYAAIDGEREYQEGPIENRFPGAEHTVGEDLLLIYGLVNKAVNAWMGEPKPEVETLHILRKIAAVAVKCMEVHGAPHREATSE